MAGLTEDTRRSAEKATKNAGNWVGRVNCRGLLEDWAQGADVVA